jgi:hypothetical protein
VAKSSFYRTSLEAIQEMLSESRKGQVLEIAHSAGGRPLWAIAYGEKEPIPRTANFSSALSAGKPEAFFGAKRRKKQVMLITSAVHGAEMESIAGVLNLINVLETSLPDTFSSR